MSAESEDEIIERLEILSGRRKVDRFFQWLAGIAGTIVTASIIWLNVSIVELRTTTAVSNTELSAAVTLLSERLEAASTMASLNVASVVQRLGKVEDRVETHAIRLRALEGAR